MSAVEVRNLRVIIVGCVVLALAGAATLRRRTP